MSVIYVFIISISKLSANKFISAWSVGVVYIFICGHYIFHINSINIVFHAFQAGRTLVINKSWSVKTITSLIMKNCIVFFTESCLLKLLISLR